MRFRTLPSVCLRPPGIQKRFMTDYADLLGDPDLQQSVRPEEDQNEV